MTRSAHYLNPDQLLIACGVMESAMIKFINQAERKGMNVDDLRETLKKAQQGVDWLNEQAVIA